MRRPFMAFYYRCRVIVAMEDTEGRGGWLCCFWKDSGRDSELQWLDLKKSFYVEKKPSNKEGPYVRKPNREPKNNCVGLFGSVRGSSFSCLHILSSHFVPATCNRRWNWQRVLILRLFFFFVIAHFKSNWPNSSLHSDSWAQRSMAEGCLSIPKARLAPLSSPAKPQQHKSAYKSPLCTLRPACSSSQPTQKWKQARVSGRQSEHDQIPLNATRTNTMAAEYFTGLTPAHELSGGGTEGRRNGEALASGDSSRQAGSAVLLFYKSAWARSPALPLTRQAEAAN